MDALIKVFKSIFGGILGFFGGLLGGKKGADGFYMEASSDQLEELPPAAAKSAPAKAAKSKPGEAAAAAPMKAPAKSSAPSSPEELIVAALAAVATPPAGTPEAEAAKLASFSFAEQNMVPTLTSGRRRPGPSLSAFKAMAKQVNS